MHQFFHHTCPFDSFESGFNIPLTGCRREITNSSNKSSTVAKMNHYFTIQQIADAARITRYQVEAWISRGHFTPQNPVEKGKARVFTFEDAVVLTTIADFNSLGLNPSVVSLYIHNIKHRPEPLTLFIIHSFIRSKKGTDSNPDQDSLLYTTGLLRDPSEIENILVNPLIYSFAVVNVKNVEDRVRKSLESS